MFLVSRQEFYRGKYKKINPGWNDSLGRYANLIDQEVTASTKILDVGCGHGDFLRSVSAKTNHTYGIDPDKRALDRNTVIKNKYVGLAEELPFKDNFFDLVVSAWVFEHLENPRKAFQEIFRVLKPDGKLIFLTPNSWNHVIWINRLIPHALHDFLTQRLYGRQESDTYPVRYKVNSVKRINKLLLQTGFKKSKLVLNGDPTYLSFNDLSFKLSCLIERILDREKFKSFRVHIIGVYQK